MGRSVAEGLGTYPGLPERLAHPDLDAVWLVTPASLHADQVIASINAGKQVSCEKPLALDPTDCDRAVAAAANHPSQVAMVGFMRRFDPAYAEAKRRIDAGQLGAFSPSVAFRKIRSTPTASSFASPRHRAASSWTAASTTSTSCGGCSTGPRRPPSRRREAASCTRRSANAATSTRAQPPSLSRAARSRPSMCRERRIGATRRP